MCGPTDAEAELQQNQIDFYHRLAAQDTAVFGQDQSILNQLQSVYAPILAAGPSQYGYTPDQENVLKTQAATGTAQAYQQASRALTEKQAALGGGDTYLPSGVNMQQQAQLASAAAAQRANQNLAIKTQGYEQGNKNFMAATNALLNTSGQLNPTGYAGVSNTGGSDAASTAETLAAQQTSWMAPVLGAVGSVAGAGLGGYLKGLGGSAAPAAATAALTTPPIPGIAPGTPPLQLGSGS